MSLLATLGLGLGAAGLGKLLDPVFNGLGNLISGGTWEQSGGQIKQNEFNAKEAQKVRDWETQMSNTAVQRGTADMQKAGINPAMAYSNAAGGASTPTGPAGTTGYTNAAGSSGNLLNAAANVAHVMNNDKHSGNNMNAGDVIKMVSNVAKIMR